MENQFKLIVVSVFTVLLVAACGSSSESSGGAASSSLNCPRGVHVVDGCTGGTGGTLQNPNLLSSGYTVRPFWNVAGVDYAVGVFQGISLKDPAVDLLPNGVSYNPNYNGFPTVIINGSDDETLDGYDFSLHGGINVYISGVNNTTISNSKFASVNSSGGIITIDQSASDVVIHHCLLDGTGTNPVGGFAFIYDIGGGTLLFQYNSLKNFQSGAVSIIGSTQVTYRYNYIENGATYPGDALSLLSFAGASTNMSADIEFNTVYQPIHGETAGEGFQFYNNDSGSTLDDTNVGYNTIIAANTNPNALTRQNSAVYNLGDVIMISGSNAAYYTCTTAGTTAAVAPSDYTSDPAGQQFTDGTAQFDGGNNSMTYLLHGSSLYGNISTALIGGGGVHDNYLDVSGALGPFYPGSFEGWTLQNNINLVDGTAFTTNP